MNTMFHIIDDEVVLSALMVELLESAGYQAVDYSDPLEYLKFVDSNHYFPPLAIITDVRMPKMGGYELIDRVRERYPQQRVIVVSGDDIGDEARNREVCHFLTKPVSPDTLFALADAITKCEGAHASDEDIKCQKLKLTFSSDAQHCAQDCFAMVNKSLKL